MGNIDFLAVCIVVIIMEGFSFWYDVMVLRKTDREMQKANKLDQIKRCSPIPESEGLNAFARALRNSHIFGLELDGLAERLSTSIQQEKMNQTPERTLQIFKHELEFKEKQEVKMPKGAEILDVQLKNDKMCIWVIAEPEKEREVRYIEILGAGNRIPHYQKKKRKHLSTIQMQGGHLVFHVFELTDREVIGVAEIVEL